jgi:hypothetical protein
MMINSLKSAIPNRIWELPNSAAEDDDVEEIGILSRIHWQIGLLFKLWKSEGHLDKTYGQGWRGVREVYAK